MARLHSPLVDRHRTSGYLPYGSVRSSGLSLEVAATRTAAAELERRPLPLLVELEVLFSCLIRKSVTCSDLPEGTPSSSQTPCTSWSGHGGSTSAQPTEPWSPSRRQIPPGCSPGSSFSTSTEIGPANSASEMVEGHGDVQGYPDAHGIFVEDHPI